MRELGIIGDVHGELERLDGVLEMLSAGRTELVILVGDIGVDPPWMWPARERDRQAHDASVRSVVGRVRDALNCEVVFVPGNHDLPVPPDQVAGVNLDGRRSEVAGLTMVGLGGAGPASFGFPYEWGELQAKRVLAPLFPDATDVFVSHTPPAGTRLDRTLCGDHVGSVAVRERLATALPLLFVCGHIHEAWGLETIDGVPCLNAGALGEPAAQQIAWSVGWSAGPRRIRSWRRDDGGVVASRDWL